MASKDMGGMRGAGSTARGMGAYGKGGAKPSGKPVRFSDRGDNRLFESQLKKLKNSRGGTFTKTTTTRAVREGRIPKRASPVNSPKQKTSPVKRKGK